jgi:hypothetical protein
MCRIQVPLHRPYPRTAWQHSEEARARDRLAICEHKLIYSYKCVLAILFVYTRTYVLIMLYIYTSRYYYVSSYYCICVLILLRERLGERQASYVRANNLLYVCPRTTMCPHTTIYVSSFYCVCPHTTIYMSSYYYMCPHTTTCVSSYCYMCPHTAILNRGRGSVKHADVC